MATNAIGRRRLLTGALALGSASSVGSCSRPGRAPSGGPTVTASVDLQGPTVSTSPFAVGYCVSTYGPTALSTYAQATGERALDARYVRLPVGVRSGRVTSSAAGAAADLDVPALVARYRSWGYRVLAVVGGRTTDVDVRPGDTRTIVSALGVDGVAYSAPNEPSHQGLSIARATDLARMILAEGREIDPGFRLWGPAWGGFDRNILKAFAAAIGPGLAGIDFHRYEMGAQSVETREAMSHTASYGDDVRAVRADLDALGLEAGVALSEVNWASEADNGTAEGEQRFYGPENTVFLTSVIGHVLMAGGSVSPYASQNGALGLMADPDNPRGWAASSPMPAYWAVAQWTGSQWTGPGSRPHLGAHLFGASSSDPSVEVFAFASPSTAGANTVTVLLVNKSVVTGKPLALSLAGPQLGKWTAFSTDPSNPQRPPLRSGAGEHRPGRPLRIDLRPLSVTSVVFEPQ